MKKKSYRGTRCEKRTMSKCADGVARTYNALESKYAEMLQENPDIKEFRCQVLLEGLEIGEYCSDFVAIKMDGDLRVRECVYRKHDGKIAGCIKELLEKERCGRLGDCRGEER